MDYVDGENTAALPYVDLTAPVTPNTVVVGAYGVSLRDLPSTISQKLDFYDVGAVVTLDAWTEGESYYGIDGQSDNQWGRISGTSDWVALDYVDPQHYITSHPLESNYPEYLILSDKNLREKSILESQKEKINCWDGMPVLETFYGRKVILEQLKYRCLETSCRMISISGHAGIGKTALAVNFVNDVRGQFSGGGIWQSLRYAPLLKDLLGQWLTHMPGVVSHSDHWCDQLSAVMEYFRNHRCLIVIDDLEGILDADGLNAYKAGYLSYREFFHRLAEEVHQSCVIVMSRNNPSDIHGFVDKLVPKIMLNGLDINEVEQILLDQKILVRKREYLKDLTYIYRGNPQMLKIVSLYILDFFDGDVNLFLDSSNVSFTDIRYLMGEIFKNLSHDERVMLKKMHNRSIFIKDVQHVQRMDMVSILLRRGLVEKSVDGRFTAVFNFIQNI